MLRMAIVVLALLVGLKLWAHEHFYRQATTDALLNAYLDRASRACRRHLLESASQTAAASAARDVVPIAKVVIGDDTLDVAFWNVGHPHWAARYKTAFLHLTAGTGGSDAVCRFDTLTGEAFSTAS